MVGRAVWAGDFVRLLMTAAAAWLGSAVCALAQGAGVAGTPAAPAFEIVSKTIDLEAAPDGRSWMTQEVIYRPLNTMGVEALQQVTLSYTAGYEYQTISAHTLKKDGRRLEVPQADILQGHGQTTTPGFEDTRTQTVVFPNVEVGDQVVLATTRVQLVPWFVNVFAAGFDFPRQDVVHQATFAFTTQGNDAAFHVSTAGLDADPPQTLGGKTRRVWHFHNDTAVKLAPDTVTEADAAPHVDITTLPDYSAVAKLYADLFRDKILVTPEISALADKLTDGIRDRRARARALYDWVSRHIRYVNIVLGAGGFVPNKAADVLKNGYGDCKDHVMLLQALLAAKGLRSSAVLILAGASRYKLPASASPFLFNHLITYVPEFQLFLDSTAEYAPFGVLPSSDAGRSVVIVDSGKVARTPAVSVANAALSSETALKINDDGSADGETRTASSGAFAVDMRAAIAALPADGDDNYFRLLLGPGSDGKLERGDPENLDGDYAFSAHYHIAHIAAFPGPGALPQQLGYKPFSFTSLIGLTLPPSRDADYSCPSGRFQETVNLTLPQGVTVSSLPASRVLAAEGAELRTDYAQPKPDTVRVSVQLKLDHPEPVCGADYYAKIRPVLSNMTGALLAQILYK